MVEFQAAMSETWAYRLFFGFLAACIVFIIAFGIGLSVWGPPTKSERISELERRVTALEQKQHP